MQQTKRYGSKEDQALDLWVKLARSFSVFNRRSSEDILRHDITLPQFGVMEVLFHKGEMTIGELCKKQLVSGGNMTVVIDNLVRDGLVERIPKADDRRAIIIRLTSKGKSLIKKVFPEHAKLIAKLSSGLTQAEQKQLASLLKKLGTAAMEH
ncbi:MAG TPA: MarR family transcriptional regulator [Candidatus Kapabacteria bacterium]